MLTVAAPNLVCLACTCIDASNIITLPPVGMRLSYVSHPLTHLSVLSWQGSGGGVYVRQGAINFDTCNITQNTAPKVSSCLKTRYIPARS